MKDYKRQKRVWQKEFRDAESLLAGIQRRLTRRSLQVGDSRLKRLLDNTAEVVQRRNIVLREFRACVKPSPLGVWERLWSQNARVKDINREIELDTRLQVQSAKMLRTFLHKDDGVSLRTIARLVVLVYFVCGLASEKRDKKDQDGRLWITDSHVISWRTVEDKLHKRRMS